MIWLFGSSVGRAALARLRKLGQGDFPDSRPESLAELQAIQRSSTPFRALGLGYAPMLQHRLPTESRVWMDGYSGIVSLEGDRVTVRAGTTIGELAAFLDKRDLSLVMLPEFMGMTAASCFFVEVHGSGKECFSMYDLIDEVKYLDDAGMIVVAARDDPGWQVLRRRTTRTLVTELTFRCVKATYLTNRLEWKSDSQLPCYITKDHAANFSTTIQWFPVQRQMLIYNMNLVDTQPSKSAPSKPLYRGISFKLQQRIVKGTLKGNDVIYDRYYKVLGLWSDLWLRRVWRALPQQILDKAGRETEMFVSLEDALTLTAALRSGIEAGEIPFAPSSSVGIRFSYRQNTDGSKTGFAWIDMNFDSDEACEIVVALARSLCPGGVGFHRGKYLPRSYVESEASGQVD